MIKVEKSKDNLKNNIHIDIINKENMNFRVLNYYPESNPKNSKDIEKRLFEIFKKYET